MKLFIKCEEAFGSAKTRHCTLYKENTRAVSLVPLYHVQQLDYLGWRSRQHSFQLSLDPPLNLGVNTWVSEEASEGARCGAVVLAWIKGFEPLSNNRASRPPSSKNCFLICSFRVKFNKALETLGCVCACEVCKETAKVWGLVGSNLSFGHQFGLIFNRIALP